MTITSTTVNLCVKGFFALSADWSSHRKEAELSKLIEDLILLSTDKGYEKQSHGWNQEKEGE